MTIVWRLGISVLCVLSSSCGAVAARPAPAAIVPSLAELIAVSPQLEEMQLEIAKSVVISRSVVLLVEEGNADELLGRVVSNEALRNA